MWSKWNPRRQEPADGETEVLKELLLGFLTNNNSGNEHFIHAFSDWISRDSNGEIERSLSISGDTWYEMILPRKVLSIVGPGATDLADDLYNTTKGLFMCCAHVKLSDDRDSMSALRSILRQVSSSERRNPANSYDDLDKPQLIDRISEALLLKRYLIVILDIWDESEWTSIASAFPTEVSCSSRVITTTRRNTVAETCFRGKLDLVYKLEHLPRKQEDAQEEAAAAMRPSANPTELADGFVKSLHSSTCPWEDCTLYLSMFQDDHEFERDSLIRKWLAEEFIADVNKGNIYFNELVNRNVILQHPDGQHRYRFGEEPTYHVRPTMLGALRKESQEKSFVRFISNGAAALSSSDTSPRRVSVIPEGQLPTQALAPSAAEPAVESAPAPAAPPHGKVVLDLCSATSVIAQGHIQGLILPLMHSEKCDVRVLDLEGCQDVENTHVVDICRHLSLLRYLSLKGTLVDVITEDVKNLIFLETLDLRRTPLKRLPEEVALLPKLERLLFSEGVKYLVQGAPVNQSTSSIKVLGAIDLSELQKPSMADYAKDVRELTVVCNGEGLPNEWPTVSLRCLENLKVSGRCVKLPAWIKQQHELSKVTTLSIRVCQLEDHKADLEALGKMVSMRSLALTLVSSPREPIVICRTSSCDNKEPLFQNLIDFALDCRVPWVVFEAKAMPALRHLYLKLYAGSSDKTPSGTVHLESLDEVNLHFSPSYAGSTSVTHTVAAMEQELAHHTGKVAVALFLDKHKHHKIPKIHALSSRSNIIQWFMRNLLECVVMPFFYLIFWSFRSDAILDRDPNMWNLVIPFLATPLFSFAFPRLLSYFLLPKITNWVAHEIARRAFDSRAITLPFPLLFYALHGYTKWLTVLRFSIFIILDACFYKPFTRAFPTMLILFVTLQRTFSKTGKINWQLVIAMFVITFIIHRLL